MTQWNEILTGGGTYWFYGKGGEVLESDNRWILQPSAGNGMMVEKDDPGTSGTKFEFAETTGGQIYLKETSSGLSVRYDTSTEKFTRFDGVGTYLHPDECNGNVVFRFYCNGWQYMAMSATGTGPTHDLVANADPADVLSQWELLEKSPPPTVDPNDPTDAARQRWLHTYVPENRCSPGAFLEHVGKVITGNDPDMQHNTAEYREGLLEADANGTALSTAIGVKILAWQQHFHAATALQRAEANGAMILASAAFYNHPESDINELDPKKPPEWADVDTELGSDPYPG